jgi:hypothetical protein
VCRRILFRRARPGSARLGVAARSCSAACSGDDLVDEHTSKPRSGRPTPSYASVAPALRRPPAATSRRSGVTCSPAARPAPPRADSQVAGGNRRVAGCGGSAGRRTDRPGGAPASHQAVADSLGELRLPGSDAGRRPGRGLAVQRAKDLFGVEHANVQPYSGSPANLAVYLAYCQPGDTVMGMALPMGGHLTHGWNVSVTGTWFHAVQYGVRRDTGIVDLDEVRDLAVRERPKLIFCGGTAIPRPIGRVGIMSAADAGRRAARSRRRPPPSPLRERSRW